MKDRGVACLRFDERNCGDVLKCIYANDPKIEPFKISVDPDETPQNAASHQGLRYLPC